MDIQQFISEDVEKIAGNMLGIRIIENSPKIFISYSHKNKSIARRLAGVLQSKGINVWLDEHNIFVGDSIHRTVSDGLDNCDNVILLISEASLESDWVNDEINATLSREKLIKAKILLPTLIENVNEQRIPAIIRDRKRAIFYNRFNEGLEDLLSAIWSTKRNNKES